MSAEESNPIERLIARQRRDVSHLDSRIAGDLERTYRQGLERIEQDLDRLAGRLNGITLPETWFDPRGRFTPTGELLFRQRYLQQMLPQVEVEYRRFANAGQEIIADGQREAARMGSIHAGDQLNVVGVTAPPQLNTPAIERFVAASQPGSPVRMVLDSYGAHASSVIAQEISDGMISGAGPRDIVRRIMAEIGGGATRARISTLVRTETMRAYRGAIIEQYGQAAPRLQGLRWVASLSPRTCLACLARHGKVYPFDQFPRDHHPNCRCVPSPAPLRTFGPPLEHGTDWLNRQPDSVQRVIFGNDDALLSFQRGDVSLDDFVGVAYSPTWGPTMRVRSWRDVRQSTIGQMAAD